ncbi:MAG: hypothetical protein R2694_18940 [Ilumatobacteraceae bacterium]|nr:hypothetical protein [Ilumatobacter sp.]MCB0984579.1 hypothetical protein [Ilumatobacter sp.]
MNRLNKFDAERLMDAYDADPVAALTAALRVLLDRPHDDWTQLVKAAGFTCARRILLQGADPVALDELAAELNELRALDPAGLR